MGVSAAPWAGLLAPSPRTSFGRSGSVLNGAASWRAGSRPLARRVFQTEQRTVRRVGPTSMVLYESDTTCNGVVPLVSPAPLHKPFVSEAPAGGPLDLVARLHSGDRGLWSPEPGLG